jgi:hypothetical protein
MKGMISFDGHREQIDMTQNVLDQICTQWHDVNEGKGPNFVIFFSNIKLC